MASQKRAAGKSHYLVFVTCGTLAEARRIARKAIQARLAACANIHRGPVESVYRWKGQIASARETLLVLKTGHRTLASLQSLVTRLHSYELAEFLAVPIAAGSPAYLAWLDENLREAKSSSPAIVGLARRGRARP